MAADRGRQVLSVEGLETCFDTDQGTLKAVDGVTFAVAEGETVGVVGESGCGKSVTALSIMNLLPRNRGRIAAGSITYRQPDGARIDLSALEPDSREMRSIRGHEIAMIFQEPMTSLNPVYTIGAQIVEAIRHHELVSKQEARRRAVELIARVGIAAPAQRVDEYPFQLSGGMRQRVMIAMALSCNPRVLIADEPTTALDVTVEAQILRLLQDLQREYRMSLMIITHDLGVIGELADRVLVMYMGRIVEQAPVDDLFYATRHPPPVHAGAAAVVAGDRAQPAADADRRLGTQPLPVARRLRLRAALPRRDGGLRRRHARARRAGRRPLREVLSLRLSRTASPTVRS